MVVNLAPRRGFFVFAPSGIKLVDAGHNIAVGLDVEWSIATFAVTASS